MQGFSRWQILGLAFLAFYAPGLLFPEVWWGTHHAAFLAPAWQFGLFALALALLVPGAGSRITALSVPPPGTSLRIGLTLGTTAVVGFLFWHFPMAADNYGDAFNYRPYLPQVVNELTPEVWDRLTTFDLQPASGRKALLALLTLISYSLQVTYEDAFRIVGVVCGMGFSLLWLVAVQQYLRNTWWQLMMGLGGLCAPFMLIFYGHMDTYAIVYVVLLAWMLGLLAQLRSNKRVLLWLLAPALLVCIKVHPITVLLGPAWLLAAIRHHFGESAWAKQLLTFKGIGLALFVPAFVAGAYLYFVVFEDHHDERLLQNAKDFDRLFLPLFSPDPPLDRYNLLSWNHLFDCLQVLLLWSPPIMLTFWGLVGFQRKAIRWQAPEVLVPLASVVLMVSFLFVINPLLSLPMDWDLFSIPAVVFLVLTLAMVKHIERETVWQKSVPAAMAMAVMTIPLFMVHAQTEPLSYRLETVGKYVFRTYYEWSPRYIHFAIGMIEGDLDLYLQRKEQVIMDLQPDALPGNDIKYAMLWCDNGILYERAKGDRAKALECYETADAWCPVLPVNLEALANFHDAAGNYTEAHGYINRLMELDFPGRKSRLSTATLISLKARQYDDALRYVDELLQQGQGESEAWQEIQTRLRTNDRLEQLSKEVR